MQAAEEAIRRMIPGSAWFAASAIMSVIVGALVFMAAAEFFPEESSAPATLAFATAGALLSVLATLGIAVDYVLAALAALASHSSNDER